MASSSTEYAPWTTDGPGSSPCAIRRARSDNSGSSQTDCAMTIRARRQAGASNCRLRPETRTSTSSRMSAMISARLSAAKTTRPTSSATSRVMSGAVNLTGVSSSEMPAVMPNQTKLSQAGCFRAPRKRSKPPPLFAIEPRLFSSPVGGKLLSMPFSRRDRRSTI